MSDTTPQPSRDTKVAVIGASGRMGSEAVRAVEGAAGLTLVGAYGSGDDLGDLGGAEVAVELTVPGASPGQRRPLRRAGRPRRRRHDRLGRRPARGAPRPARRRAPAGSGAGVGVLIAPNFAIGALLMMSFAAKAAPFFESVEVIELHHPDKVDAPSGTAARTAAMIGQARSAAGCRRRRTRPRTTPTAPAGPGWTAYPCTPSGCVGSSPTRRCCSATPGEMLTLRHDSFDRACFMPGVIAAVRAVGDHPGLTVGLEHYLGLA